MTNEEFDKQIEETKKMLDSLPEDFEFQKQLLKTTLENLRIVHNTPTKDELGLSSVAEKLQTLNTTIEDGLRKIEDIKNHKEEK